MDLKKLTRLFGAESDYRKFRDHEVEGLIREFIFTNASSNGGRMNDLPSRTVRAQRSPVASAPTRAHV